MSGQPMVETTDCDFKLAVERGKPKSWLKSISAFSNGLGGTLVFGISDEHETIGLNNPQSDAEFISEAIKERIRPLPSFTIESQIHDGKCILLVHVKSDAQSPHYYCADGRNEAYVRVGNQSVIAPPAELNELILRGTNRTWDSLDSRIPTKRASFTVLRAIYAQRTGNDLEETDLASFGLVTEEGTLTNAGALLADEPLVRHSRVFCTRWGGLEKDSFVDTAEYEGSLLILLREARAFVRRHTIESWEKTPSGRIDRRSYSDRAVEEALVNALIHRSYLELGSEVSVDMYDDRMEIVSPGEKIGRPLPDDVMTERVPSERRNPIVADLFHRMHYMERRGSGLRTICSSTAAEDAYLPAFKPNFEVHGGFFWVTLWNMNADGLASHEAAEKFLEVPRSSSKFLEVPRSSSNTVVVATDEGQSHNESLALDLMAEGRSTSAPEVAEATGTTRRGASKLLARLVERGLVERIGAGNATRYQLTQR